MHQGKKILGLIPARANSKGIPGKNIVELAGKPLIAWTIEAALESKYLDRIVVSTDGDEIKQTALKFGADVPFDRPAELGADDTPGIAPVIHACQELPEYDFVVLLQPTSPLRTADDIDRAIESLFEKQADFCVGVVRPKHHPNWLLQANPAGKLENYEDRSLIGTRQALPELYALNGALYVANVRAMIEQKTLCGSNLIGYPMEAERSFDIDTPFDLQLCEFLIQKS